MGWKLGTVCILDIREMENYRVAALPVLSSPVSAYSEVVDRRRQGVVESGGISIDRDPPDRTRSRVARRTDDGSEGQVGKEGMNAGL